LETLGLGNMKDAVQLPEGEDINEWFAVNVVDLYNELSMLYATIADVCTRKCCPKMQAGPSVHYLWSDGQRYKRPTEFPAPVYIGLLFDWVDEQLQNEALFPSVIGVPFPKNFDQIVRNIMKRLFRVYAHSYCDHLQYLTDIDILKHLNTSFKHFIFFAKEFNLIPQDQLDPLKVIIEQLDR
jgi:MOB kinase activator 1